MNGDGYGSGHHDGGFRDDLEQQHMENVVKGVYAGAADPSGFAGPRGPDVKGGAPPSGSRPGFVRKGRKSHPVNWRKQVNSNFVKRRQTPAQTRKNLVRMSSKMAALRPINLPVLPKPRAYGMNDSKAMTRALRRSAKEAKSEALRSARKRRAAGLAPTTKLSLFASGPVPSQPNDDRKRDASRLSETQSLSGSAKIRARARAHLKKNTLNITSPRKLEEIKNLPNHNQNQTYSILPPDPKQLYLTSRTVLDKLPLELFDKDEADPTPQEWVALGQTKYRGLGTPARSLFYTSRQWVWTPCVVKSYNAETKKFRIEFQNPVIEKEVPRLSLLFNDENERLFHERVERCRKLREEARAIRRYTAFVDSQPSMMFSPLQQAALHGILGKLMTNSQDLVFSRQRSVDQLFMEVREEYSRSMKQAIIDYKRRDPAEAKKMESLRLPALKPILEVPFLAVETIHERCAPISRLIKEVENSHYTHFSESTLVISALYTSWDSVKTGRLLSISENRPPMPLYDYDAHQQTHFSMLRARVINDWRALVINLIRDNLNSVFKLFVNDHDEYETSELKRFLAMVSFMLRHQLTSLVHDSITDYVTSFIKYGDPRKMDELVAWGNTQKVVDNAGTCDAEMKTLKSDVLTRLDQKNRQCDQKDQGFKTPQEYIQQYLTGPRAGLGPPGTRPLLLFKMSTSNGEVIFMPPLESIEGTINGLVNLPNKIQDIHEIHNEVVPLLGIGEVPLCSPDNSSALFQHAAEAQELIGAVIEDNLKHPRKLAQLYSQYAFLLTIDTEEYVREWFPNNPWPPREGEDVEDPNEAEDKDEYNEYEDYEMYDDYGNPIVREDEVEVEKPKGHTLKETNIEIQKYLTAIQEIQNLSPTEMSFRLIKVECHMVKTQLIAKAKEISTRLMEGLSLEVSSQNTRITGEFEEMLARITKDSENVQMLAELKDRAKSIESKEIPALRDEITHIQHKLMSLANFQHPISRDDFDLNWNVLRFPNRIMDALDLAKDQIEKDNEKFQALLQHEQTVFQAEMEEYSKEVDTFVDFGVGTVALMEQYAAKVEALQDKLDKAEEMVQSFNERDALFGEIPLEYSELADLRKKFKPYFQLWSTTQSFHGSWNTWMNGSFIELDPVAIQRDVNQWHKLMYKLERELLQEDAVKPARVASEMRQKIGEFKENVCIIEWLRTPGLQSRHWDEISSILAPDKPVLSPDDLTLSQILSLDVHSHKEAIEEIAVCATKEYALEQNLEKMLREWKAMDLDLEEYNQTGTYVLRKSEDILTLLDDQIMKTQTMRGSAFIKYFEARTKRWEAKLQLISQIMEEWLVCQVTWLYLEPIFSSEDIMRQMPTEGRRFNVVDAHWRKTMAAAKKMPNLLDFVNETEGLLKTFQESNRMLERIGKGLQHYLDQKRMAFPRFYFLSNDELLSILSQTKNATAVQPHLSKCFDAIQLLDFAEETQIIGAMMSAKGERVDFIEKIDPNEGAKKGNVEVWLADVERIMKHTLHYCMRYAMDRYVVDDRTDWVTQHPGMIVLAANQYFWTGEVEQALENGTQGLISYAKKLKDQLARIVELVRGRLDKIARLTMGALVVIDVHARDVVDSMIEDRVESVTAFEWLAQMRYYWDAKQTLSLRPPTKKEAKLATPDGDLRVRMLNTQMDYGFEYLGNSSRLVITPLTDRCYRTLVGAIHLHLGGAPEGPAGTGKTETVKDLSKAVAIQCVVFNGSDGLTFKSMAKFFKGLASSGAWACFDEFNRIELEVLSVIAQQISTIQRAIIEKKATFTFDNVNIPLIPTCSVFITMNPGYAGRAELPDNLKVLFRTVAMMIPDYAMIAEIVLYSSGYSNARELSRKIVACLRLSSEQLSSQDHYDFGMRNLKSILTAAGNLKRAHLDEKEDFLCLRSICDCNLPKFVAADIPLFTGIINDLFPKVQLNDSAADHAELLAAARPIIKKMGLQSTTKFETKVSELYDTIMVRHGLMIVGTTFSAKSTLLKVLKNTLTEKYEEVKDQKTYDKENCPYMPVTVKYLNPKAITLDQLYGYDDKNTHEWFDGVLPTVMRQLRDPEFGYQWLTFDGPVDALWIENMNTVLDDNMKLCLASGEVIKLNPRMRMMFEVEDLQHASPATVSRCGMVYMEPSVVGWRPLVETWLTTLPSTLDKHLEEIRTLFNWILPPLLEWYRLNVKAISHTLASGHVSNLCKMFMTLLDEFFQMEADEKRAAQEAAELKKKQEAEVAEEGGADGGGEVKSPRNTHAHQRELERREREKEELAVSHSVWLESWFIFSVVWSVGCSLDKEGREEFSEFFRRLINGQAENAAEMSLEHAHMSVRIPFPMPDSDSKSKIPAPVFDYVFNTQTNEWVSWMETIDEYHVPRHAKYNDIIVPTVSNIRVSWCLESLLTHGYHTLLVGPTGTGKSMVAAAKITKELPQNKYMPMLLDFSARTSANQVQDIIDNNLERRRIGTYGPPLGKKAIIFVDDLNMPQKEEYDAQPAIELLRQWMDYGGWYERKQQTFRRIIQTVFCAAMLPPGGGRNEITCRYSRHFNLIAIPSYDDNALRRIFGIILHNWLDNFPAKIRTLKDRILSATIAMFDNVQKHLLPTPTKSHYTFNMRDVSKVFQGMLSAHPKGLSEPSHVIRLWGHECTRVFCDRLTCDEDITEFSQFLMQETGNHFELAATEVFPPDSSLMYTDFANAATREYLEVKDMKELSTTVNGYLADYNQMEKHQMNLVLFKAAIEHIARISRIIRQPFGNALLVGVGGSGRQSLTRLASVICDYDVCQVEITKAYSIVDWREDLRGVMQKAGVLNRSVVFLFTDTQIKDESFLEDINSMLNKGEVPNLFGPEDFAPLIEQIMPDARRAGQSDSNAQIFNFFVNRCKNNIHVVFCASPVGDEFRKRLRAFPSFVNCTTIDWFHPWPTDALKSVAARFLRDVDLEEDIKTGVVEVCVDMQERVVALSKEYKETLRRHNYVTPTSYLELIKLFRNLFETKRMELANAQNRYENGLKKLNDTAVQVKAMQVQLEALRPELIKSSKETQELIKTIEKRSVQVAETRRVVTAEEKECNEQAEAAQKIKDECTAQLSEAMPALQLAMKALKVIKKPALDELRTMKVPTQGVLLTMEALCIMMGVQPNKVGPVGKKRLDYWEPAKKKLLNNTKFMQKLQNYDKDNIPASIIAKVRPYCKNPDFSPAKIANASRAAEGFCKWVLAMEVYDHVVKQVKPKRQALLVAENQLSAAYEQLAAKKAQLKEVQDLLDDLNTQFDLVNRKKKSLEAQVKECSERLDRAEKLIGGLRVEKERWLDKATSLAADYNNVVGDILVSSGVVAYLGVFTHTYRQDCVEKWTNMLSEKKIPRSDNFKLSKVLGNEVSIRKWGLQMLPKDDFSIDNAIIIHNSLRWPLIIDPQEQAVRWVKNMEREKALKKMGPNHKAESKIQNSMIVCKQTDDRFGQMLTNAVQIGICVLVENVGETLDPILEPLLTRAFTKQGTRLMVRLGAEVVPYDKEFRLYLCGKMQNPHYSPEITTRCTVVNFMATPIGLEDQMLGHVVSLENPELEDERGRMIVKNAENKAQLQMIEDQILEHLNEAEGNILDDEDLINTLQKSKQACKLIEKRVAQALKAQHEINEIRDEYQPVAFGSSNLFFCISDLANVDPMYQYSLRWFINLFYKAVGYVQETEHTTDVPARVAAIDARFTYSLYVNVCRSLFEKDKILFSFLLWIRILQGKKLMDPAELRFLMTGNVVGSDEVKMAPNPGVDHSDGKSAEEAKWLPDTAWKTLNALGTLPAFEGIAQHFIDNLVEWKEYFDDSDPFTIELPVYWENLTVFQRLCVLRALRPDKVIVTVTRIVSESEFLGREFVEPPPFNLHEAFKDSDSTSPLIFVLSPGVDPSKDVFNLAVELLGTSQKLFSISLGQGQGPFAENAIREAIDAGTWVLLQNCHLSVSWLPTLEKIVDEINPATTNPDFRLWLTSMPSPDFPVSILQNGVKMTNEPPKGIRANMLQSFNMIDNNWFLESKRPDELKQLFFGLAFFHANVLERRKFGALGWNILYEFTESDLDISKTQLNMFLDQYANEEVPFKALQYLIGQLNYGGRVTDDWDRRLIACILEDFVSPRVLEEECRFDLQGNYMVPAADRSLDEICDYIRQLPEEDDSEVFGLHDNSTITAAISEGNELFNTLLTLQPRSTSSGAGGGPEEVAYKIADDISSKLPLNFDLELARKKYPVVYAESMNTVMVQELTRCNKLLSRVRSSLVNTRKAIKGLVVMSQELEDTMLSLYNGQVPATWSKVAYPSLRTLTAWVEDLLKRCEMFSNWLENGPPGVFWMSGFFFTQSFLTGTMQDFARSYKIPIDQIGFDFEVMPDITPDHPTGPADGCYIHGLYLEGARWDIDKGVLAEAHKRQLLAEMPTIWLHPTENKALEEIRRTKLTYACPVYKTSARHGTLSTTGHSTNFVLPIELPSEQQPEHWVKRGTALLLEDA